MTKKKTFSDIKDELCSDIINCENIEQFYEITKNYYKWAEKSLPKTIRKCKEE